MYRIGNGDRGPSCHEAIKKKTVLFLCMYNSVRSQIAEGLMRSRFSDQFEVYSAGIAPAGLHPYAVKTMREIGIDITGQRSKSVRDFRGMQFDYVVSFSSEIPDILGSQIPSGKIMLTYPVRSPSDLYGNEQEALADFRRLREELMAILEQAFRTGTRPRETGSQ